MNLCDRLQIPTPKGYGRVYFFKYKGQESTNKTTLILLVVERYAGKFGRVTQERANEMYMRLSRKYCASPGCNAVYRALRIPIIQDGFIAYAHPREEAKKSFCMKWAREQIKVETDRATGVFSWISEPPCAHECRICTSRMVCSIYVPKLNRSKEAYRHYKKYYNICRSPLCKAVAQLFPAAVSDKKIFPLAFVLKELTKNGDRSERIKEFSTAIERNANAVNERGDRKKRGKSNKPFSQRVWQQLSTST